MDQQQMWIEKTTGERLDKLAAGTLKPEEEWLLIGHMVWGIPPKRLQAILVERPQAAKAILKKLNDPMLQPVRADLWMAATEALKTAGSLAP